MDLNTYQEQAKTTKIYPEFYTVLYPVLKLAGETGELAEKIGKKLRDNSKYPEDEENWGLLTDTIYYDVKTPLEIDFKDPAIIAELGDILWYLAAIATDLGVSLNDVAEANLAKLASRKERGKLQGSGDTR